MAEEWNKDQRERTDKIMQKTQFCVHWKVFVLSYICIIRPFKGTIMSPRSTDSSDYYIFWVLEIYNLNPRIRHYKLSSIKLS